MRKITIGKVPANNTQIPYARIGEGPKHFVILPGLSIRPVSPSAEAVANRYKLIPETYTIWLLDRPEELPEKCTFKDLAQSTADAMKQLGISRAAVFGVSQGGMLAMYLAAEYPELVAKLVLGSTASCQPEIFRERLAAWKKMVAEKDHRGLTQSFVDWMYGKETLRLYRDSLLAQIPVYSEDELTHFSRLLGVFDAADLEEQPAKIRCPALVITCRGDNVFGPEPGRKIAKELHGMLYEYGSEYGHAVYDEAPDYTECILFFIRRKR